MRMKVRHIDVRSEKGVVERQRDGENVYSPFYEKECLKSVLQCFSVMRTPLANENEAGANENES